METIFFGIAIAILGYACYTDLLYRQIQHRVVIVLLLEGIIMAFVFPNYHLSTWGISVLAMTICGYPLFAMGGLGAGDIKVFAALSGIIGLGSLYNILTFAFYSALAGGALSVLVVLIRNPSRIQHLICEFLNAMATLLGGNGQFIHYLINPFAPEETYSVDETNETDKATEKSVNQEIGVPYVIGITVGFITTILLLR